MKKRITTSIGLALLLTSASFMIVPQAVAEEDECDWFCETWNKISSIASDVDKIWYWARDTWTWARDTATDVADMTAQVDPDDILNAGKDIFLDFRDNPPDCAFLFEEITAINPGFDSQNPSTDDFFAIKLLAGLPFEYAKDAFPDDTFSTPVRIPALLPYYTYTWCMAHVERDMINADTLVRDSYHEDILDKLATTNEHLLNIIARLGAIEDRLSNVENLLVTPSGKRSGWNK